MISGKLLLVGFLAVSLLSLSIGMAAADDLTAITEEGSNISATAFSSAKGALKKVKFAVDLDGTGEQISSNDETTFIDIINTNVRLKGSKNQCVEIRYSGDAGCNTPSGECLVQYRALIDGNPANPSPHVYWAVSEPGNWDHATFMWWQCGLTSGGSVHNVQIQFRPIGGSDTSFARKAVLAIEYKK
jgi:hypothetical protein